MPTVWYGSGRTGKSMGGRTVHARTLCVDGKKVPKKGGAAF